MANWWETDPDTLALNNSPEGIAQGLGDNPTPTTDTGAVITSQDPNLLLNQGQDASQSSAPPYIPMTMNSVYTNPVTGGTNQPLSQVTTDQEYTNMNTPKLPPGSEYQYTNIENSPDQEIQNNGQYTLGQLDANGMPINLADGAGLEVNAPNKQNASTYEAVQMGTANVTDELAKVLNSGDANGDGYPDWAQPAVTSSQQRMNALGLGASTLAAAAQTSAILTTALPMAMANASFKQQSMLSNAGWENASRQFNAQSQNQMVQFFESLTAQIATQNADRMSAVRQFNAGQLNDMTKFLSNLNNQRDMFNTQNQLAIDQSNVQWRRTINTANTAGLNAANMANAQNLFNMSQTALNNLWQQSRDEASWSLTAQENSRNRFLSLVNSALNRQTSLQILASTLNANMFSQLGSFATNLLGGSFGSKAFDSIFGTGNSGFQNSDFAGFDDVGGTDIDNLDFSGFD